MAKMNSKVAAALIAGATAGSTMATVYTRVVRPWTRRWGTTGAEVRRVLPGDDLVSAPRLSVTHAVTIRAPVAEVWRWLVQIGQGRAGFYSYDWIENLMGLGIQNAGVILPEFQSLQVGDRVPLAPDFGIPVALLQPRKALVLFGDTRLHPGTVPTLKRGDYFASSWGWFLDEISPLSSRLVERWRADWNPSLSQTLFMRAFLEPGAFLMERKMLLGIKERAEKYSRHA